MEITIEVNEDTISSLKLAYMAFNHWKDNRGFSTILGNRNTDEIYTSHQGFEDFTKFANQIIKEFKGDK